MLDMEEAERAMAATGHFPAPGQGPPGDGRIETDLAGPLGAGV